MKAPLAAAYVGLSPTKFFRKIDAGEFPQGEKDGGNCFWYLEDLDAALDRRHGDSARSGADIVRERLRGEGDTETRQ